MSRRWGAVVFCAALLSGALPLLPSAVAHAAAAGPAKTVTELHEFIANQDVEVGRPTAIVGHLLTADTLAPLSGRTVQLYTRLQDGAGPWTAGVSTTTDHLGRAVFNEATDADTDYQLRYAGDATTEAVDSEARRVSHQPPTMSWMVSSIVAVAGDGTVAAYWSPPNFLERGGARPLPHRNRQH